MIWLVVAHELVINHNAYMKMKGVDGFFLEKFKVILSEVMAKGVWGAETHLVVASNVFGVSFNLIVSLPNYEDVEEIQKIGSAPRYDKYYIMHTSTTILQNTFGNHFVSMIPKKRISGFPSYADIAQTTPSADNCKVMKLWPSTCRS
jgi:hypothetical protein